MGTLRNRLLLAVSTCLIVSAGGLKADEGEDFWEAYNSWQNMVGDLIGKGADLATYDKRYASYLAALGTGKGKDPVRDTVKRAMLVLRAREPSLGYEAEKMEKELRALWATLYKPDRTADFLALYNRYMGEKKYRDAARIAEECYRDYGWTWESRDWLERIISALALVPEMKDQLSARVEEYHNKHMTQLGSSRMMSAGISRLYARKELDQAARLVESCLAAYKDCDWEPQFLLHAVNIHTARADAPRKDEPKAATNIPPAPKPPLQQTRPLIAGTAGTGGTAAKPVPGRPLTIAPPASEIKSVECAFAAVKRCAETYPYEPQSADAILTYLQWALAPARDPAIRNEAGQLILKHLTEHKAAPSWAGLYQTGKRFAAKDDPAWTDLAAIHAAYAGGESNRNEQLKAVLEPAADRLSGAKALNEFIMANPETVQARKAFAALRALVPSTDWGDETQVIERMTTNALAVAFAASPAYRRQQLTALATSGIEPASSRIAKSFIDEATTPVQKEWAYYMNHYRYVQRGSYDLPAFKLWVENYKDSYPVPDQLAYVTGRAMYNQRPEEAAEACNAAVCKELANSLTLSVQVGGNVWMWLHRACEKAIKEEGKKAPGQRRNVKLIERDALMKANEQANLIEEAQCDKIDLGRLYWCASSWDDGIDFRTKRGMSAKQILRQKDYRGSYYYFFSGANKKDQKK